jgi:hypothetical protein
MEYYTLRQIGIKILNKKSILKRERVKNKPLQE